MAGLERRRDSQQWMLDLAVKMTGREQNFEYDSRPLPAGVKSYAQIPAAMGRLGADAERMARQAELHGHRLTALELYFRASQHYRYGQHVLFEDDNRNKLFLYERMAACYAKVIEFCPYEIRPMTFEQGGQTFEGLLHVAPGGGRKPTVLLIPGMDMTKESYPSPMSNPFAARGMNVLAIDGPGQGISNVRKVRVGPTNYELAGSAAIGALHNMEGVDVSRIVLIGLSMGSYWGLRIAAGDPRLAGVATAAAYFGERDAIFERSSPRFKQVFMYMAGIHNEDEFDRVFGDMSLTHIVPEIGSPTLMAVGEYDPLASLSMATELFERMTCVKELWVLEDDFHSSHRAEGIPNLAGGSVIPCMIDWLSDVCDGKKVGGEGRKVFVRRSGGLGVYGPEVEDFELRSRYAL